MFLKQCKIVSAGERIVSTLSQQVYDTASETETGAGIESYHTML